MTNYSEEIWESALDKARNADLRQVMDSLGIKYKCEGNNAYRCHKSFHDSLTFNQSGNKWLWCWHSRGKGGDAINFLEEFEGMDRKEAIDYLSGGMITYHSEQGSSQYNKPVKRFNSRYDFVEVQPTHQEELKEFIPPTESKSVEKAYMYLINERGLSPKIVKWLIKNDFVRQEEIWSNNVIFKVYDRYGTSERRYIGAEKVATQLKEGETKTWKGLHKNSNTREYGFELCRGNGRSVAFFESTIDLLAFMELTSNTPEYKDFRFVSMAGVKDAVIYATMERYNIPSKRVYIASDNDTAGNKLARKVYEKFPDIHRLIPPVGKDWNDFLRLEKGIYKLEDLMKPNNKENEKESEKNQQHIDR